MKFDLKRVLALIMTVVMVVTTITFTAGNTLKAEGEEPAASEPVASEPAEPEPEQKSEPVAEEPAASEPSDNQDGEEAVSEETAEEAVTEEEPEEEEEMPAQSFSKTAGNGIHVSANAPEGAFPEGTSMSVSAVSRQQAMNLVEGAAGEVEDANGVDITFHKDGKEIQPEKSISVSLSNAAVDGEGFSVYHVDGGSADRVAGATSNGASFSAKSFSIYIIAGEGTGEPEEDGVATYKFVIDDVVQDDFTQIVKKGDNLYKPEVAAEDGKVFSGWFKSDGTLFTGFGEVTETFEGSDTEITLYGTYESGEYNVYFHVGDKICETRTGATGTQIDTSEILAATEKGQSALGWYADQAFTEKVDVVTIGTSDMHLYAKVSQGNWISYDSDGGTPVESTFVASGDNSVEPAAPEKAGYTFNYWTLNGNKYTFGQTLSSDIELKASWKAGDANYTVIHWWENADDDDYSFHEAETKNGTSGETTAATAKSYEGFTVQSFSQQTIAGDGSTIVNIKYKRQIYTVHFNDGKPPLICGLTEHEHTSECMVPSCGKEEHEHDSDCYSLTCGEEAHQHTNTCYGYVCGKEAHQHTGACYSNVSSSAVSSLPGSNKGVVETLSDGSRIYEVKRWFIVTWYEYYLQAPDGKYYEVSDYSTGSVKLTCKKEAHTHTEGCTGLICGKDVHVHTDACYELTCTKEVHQHTDACYTGSGSKKCTLTEHKHTAACYSTENTGTTITAKYGAYIGDQWPGGAYRVSQSGSTWQAYLEIMPLDGKLFYDKCSGYTSTAYYYVRTIDDTGWTLHHKDEPSVGTSNSVTKEDQYDLKGFTFNSGKSTRTGENYDGAKFYYDRNSYDIKFINNGSVDKTVTKKYEADISDAGYTPTAPAGKSNYTFAGWYDNEYCEGNAYNFSGKKMPANNVTLYAKWEAPKVTVTAYNRLNDGEATDIVLEYGQIIPKDKLPSSPDGEILGWVTKSGNGYKLFNIGSRIYTDTVIYPYVAKSGGPYTITYDKNGATGTAPTDSGRYMADTNATVAGKGDMTAPEGKHFAGWSTSSYSTGDNIYQPGEQLAMTQDYTLYAQWETKTADTQLTLNYQYPEGDNKTEDITAANNGKVTLPGAGKTIAGWQFAGWYTQPDGQGTKFTGSVRVDNKLIENNTLYGYWVAQNVGYEVLHKIQKTDGTYEVEKTETKSGLTGQMTDAQVDASIEAKGYKALSYDNAKIKGDGSTEVVIKYDRNEFSLTVHYKYKNNEEKAAEDVTRKVVKGNNYNIVSPSIEGFTPDRSSVTGTMGSENIEETVYYSPSQPLTIDVSTAEYSGIYDGQTHGGAVTPSVSAAKGTTVEYSTDNGETWSAGYPTIKNQGTINVKVKATNARYGDAEASYVLKVERRAAVVKGNAQTKTYGSDDPELTAQVSNAVEGESGKISYTVGRDEGEDVGTYATKPTGEAIQGNYTVTYENGSLEITKAGAFEVTASGFNGPFDNQTHAGTVSASVTEGTTFEYSTDGGNTYSKDAPTVKNVTADPVNVKVKASNKNYETAYAEYSLNVTPAAVTVEADNKSKMYGTADPELTATVTGVLEEGIKLDYTVSRDAGTDVGKYDITVTGDTVQGNYKITYKSAEFEIYKSTELTIDVSGCQYNKPYDAETHGSAAVPSDTATVKYSINNGETWTEQVPKVKDVADSTAVKVKAESSNYVTAEASYELTVTHAPVTVTATNSGKTYGANDPELPGYVTGLKGGEAESLIKYSVEREAGENVGTYEITPSGDKIQGNYEVAYAKGVFTISEADTLKVTGTDIEAEYDGEFHGEAAVATVTEGTKIEYSVDNGETWTENVPKIKNVADSKTVKVRASNSNYKTATSSYSLTITRKAVSVTADDAEKTYGENDPARFNATVSGTVGTDTVDYSVKRQKSALGDEDTGTYEGVLIASGTQQQGNYTVSFYPGTFTINKADGLNLNVDGAGYEGTYDANAHGSAASVSPSKTDGTDLKYSTDGGNTWKETAPTRTAAGTTNVIAKAEHKNFNTVTKEYSIKINPKEVTVSAGNYSKMFKEADPEFTPTESGLLNGDKLNYSVQREAGESVGNYEIYFTGATEQGNYSVTFIKGNLEITDNNTLIVTPNNGSWEYDNNMHSTTATANIPAATVEYKVENGNWSTVAPSIINPGTMTVDVRAKCEGYATASGQYTLTITRKEVTVTADDINITYGDTVPALTATVTGELTGQPVKYSLSRQEGTAAGKYTITPAGDAEQYGYAVTYVEGSLNIKSKEIGDDKKKLKDGFELTGLDNVMYDGEEHKNAPTLKDTKAGNTLKEGTDYTVSYKTDFEQDNFTDAGTIVVTITGKGNYSGTVEKTYKITKRPVTLTSASQERKYNGSPLTDSNVTIGGEGFVGGEGATFDVTGTITEVGTVDNEFTYELNNGTKAGNYNITTSAGTLKITVDDSQVTVTVTGNKKAEVYDGTEKSVKGYTAVSDVERYNVSKNVKLNGTDEVKGTAAKTYNMGLAASKFENSNTNYNNVRFDVTDGKLVIVPQSIDPEDDDPPSYDDPEPVYDGIKLVNDPSDVKYDGKEHQWYPELTDKNGDKLTYGDDYTVSWEKTSGNFTDVGTINVTITGKGNYGGTISKSYRITPKEVTVKADSDSKLYGNADPKFTASVDGTAADNIKYTVTRPGAGEAANEAVKKYANAIVPAGDAVQGNFAVTYEKADFEITKAKIGPEDDPSYTGTKVGTIKDVTYNGTEQMIKPSVKDKDGKPLTEGTDYEVSFSEDCKNAGTVTVTVTGIGGYDGTVTRTYDITPADVTITMHSTSKTYGEDDPEFEYDAVGIKGSDDLKIKGVREKGETVGEYKISATYDETNANYNVTVKTGTFTIAKANTNTVVVESTEVAYDGNSHGLKSVKATKDGSKILYASDPESTQWSTTEPSYKEVGTHTVYVKATNPDYEDSPIVTGTVTINRAAVKINTESASKTYDGSALTAGGTISGVAKSEGYKFSATGTITNAGTTTNSYSLEWDKPEYAANYTISEDLGTLIVYKQSINEDDPKNPDPEDPEKPVYAGIKVGTIEGSTYDGETHKNVPVVTDKNGSKLTYGQDFIIDYPEDCTNAGKITATIRGINNYGGSVKRTYEIAPKDVTILAGTYTKTYGTDDPAFDKFTVSGTISDADTKALNVKCQRVKADEGKQDVGDTIGITATYTPNSNYVVEVTDGTLTIVQSGENFVTVTDYSKHYDGKAHTVTAKAEKAGSTIEYATKAKADEWSTTAPEFTKCGQYKVYVRATNKNYKTTAVVEGNVVISQATFTVTTESDTKTFDGKPLQAGGSYNGLVNGEKLAGFETTGSQTAVGSSDNTYKIDWGSIDKTNYSLTENLGTLTVTEKSISSPDITVDEIKSVPYNGNPQKQPIVVKDNGTVLEEGVDYTLVYPDDCTNSGTIAVTIVGKGNYSGTNTEDAHYNITKLDATVTAKDAKKKVGTTDPESFETTTTGTLEGESVTIDSVTRAPGEHVGTYAITPAGPANQRNYKVDFVAGEFEITKASIDPKDGSTIISDVPENYVYNGTNDNKWIPVVTDKNGTPLRSEDYEVIYKRGGEETTDFESAGEITVIIKAKDGGDYTGEATRTYKIKKADLAITVSNATKAYKQDDPKFSGTAVGLVAKDKSDESRIKIEYGRIAADKDKENVGADITITATVSGSAADNYDVDVNDAKLTIQKASGNVVTIEEGSGQGIYNGTEQKLVKASAMEGSTIWYSLDGKEWSKEQPGFKDRGDYIVKVKATHPDYDDSAVVDATVVIAPKDVNVSTESAAKGYDGKPLTAKASIEGLVKGESVTIKATGTQTDVGRSENTYEITWGDVKKDNYKLTDEIGWLTVHIASVDPDDPKKPDPEDPDPNNPVYTGISTDDYGPVKYNGKEHKWIPALTDQNGKKLVEGEDYSVEYLTDDMTNAGTVKVRIIGNGPHYAGVIVKTYKIDPRNVVLTSASATKQYDGTELRADTITVSGDGFVDDEGFVYEFMATGQTEVGSKANAFTYKLYTDEEEKILDKEEITVQAKTTDAQNYNVETVFGTLTVTAAATGGDGGGDNNPGANLFVNNTATQIADEDTPTALKLFGEDCCILHLLIMLAALLLLIWYTRDMKARQRRILELEEELGINGPLE